MLQGFESQFEVQVTTRYLKQNTHYIDSFRKRFLHVFCTFASSQNMKIIKGCHAVIFPPIVCLPLKWIFLKLPVLQMEEI